MKLISPIQRGGGAEPISEVTVQKPSVGALRGVKLTNLLQMDINTMMVVLPRITSPALLPVEVAEMDPADFLTLSGEVVGFFMNPADLAAAADQVKLN
jgi:hypothetical protein